jgi:hypothetical protein
MHQPSFENVRQLHTHARIWRRAHMRRRDPMRLDIAFDTATDIEIAIDIAIAIGLDIDIVISSV